MIKKIYHLIFQINLGSIKKWLGTSKIYNGQDKEFKNNLVKEAAKIQKTYLKNNKFNLKTFDTNKIPKILSK